MRRLVMRSSMVLAIVVCSLVLTSESAFSTGIAHTDAEDDYFIYLPLVSRSCGDYSVYSAASTPLLSVGETITVTGALVNDGCANLGYPQFLVFTEPDALMLPNHDSVSHGITIQPGYYDNAQFTLRAVSAGQVTVTVSANFEINYSDGRHAWGRRDAVPLIIRILSN
jgi:hypothetical protein